MKTFLDTLNKNNIGFRSFALLYVLLSIVTSITFILMTHAQGNLGEASHIGDVEVLVRFLLLYTVIAGFNVLSEAMSTLLQGRFGAAVSFKLRENFVNYFLYIPFSIIEKVGSGEALSIYTNDLPMAEDLVTYDVFGLVSDVIFLAAALIFMFTISPLLTLALLLIVPVLIAIQALSARPIYSKSVLRSQRIAEFNAIVNDSLQNTSVIASYGLEDIVDNRCMDVYEEYISAIRAYGKAMLPLTASGMLTSLIPLGGIYFLATLSVINGSMYIAEFIAFSALVVVVGEWVGSLSARLSSVASSSAGANRLNSNTCESFKDLHIGSVSESHSLASICFNNVSFSYNDDSPLAVDRISFNIKHGSRVALVGGSGSGKSTTLKLLLGLYKPNSGTITVGGKDSKMLCDLHDMFAYVPQDCFLFPTSIKENIVVTSDNFDPERFDKACKDAGIHDFIMTQGFETVLTEFSENVSGGQRQRIAMARAFYKDAPVILLDEATSALDPLTEMVILDSINRLTEEKTVIIVTHRAEAILSCDTVIFMDNGKIMDIGSHEELVEKNVAYQRLYKNQLEQKECK